MHLDNDVGVEQRLRKHSKIGMPPTNDTTVHLVAVKALLKVRLGNNCSHKLSNS